MSVLPVNASDPTLVYELVSGEGVVLLDADKGIVKTTGAGEAEIRISAHDEFEEAAPKSIKLKVDAALTWFERAFWFVDTTVDYGNGHNYVPENDGENGKPEKLIDSNNSTYLMMVKPGKPAYNGHKHPDGAEYGFIIDLGGLQEFNLLKWRHRNTNTNFQAFKIKVSGSER